MSAGGDDFSVRDALKALVSSRSPLDDVVAELDAILFVTASPATPPAARDTLLAWLQTVAGGDTRVETLTDLVRQRGPAPWFPDLVAEITVTTGLSRAEATLLLAALPLRDWDEPEFLTDEQRRLLQLEMAEAVVARMELLTVPRIKRVSLLAAAMPQDPRQLWDRGPNVDSLAVMWDELCGPRVPVDEQLLQDLGQQMGFPTDVLRTFTASTAGDWLHVDGLSRSDGRYIDTRADVGDPFSDRHLPSAARGLAWLAYHLPAGHPLRPRMPGIHALIRARLRNPQLLIGSVLLPDGWTPVPAALVPGLCEQDGVWHHVRPAALIDQFDAALDLIPPPSAASIRMMMDPDFERLVGESQQAGYLQNPALAVPHLLEEVQGLVHVNADAASYYLQLLVLPDPTDELVRRWTGWSAQRLAAAGAALLEQGLVKEANRPSSGRRLFLPGEWIALKFVPAFEEWKAPLYRLTALFEAPFRWTLVARPVRDLFEEGVSRLRAGDIPHEQPPTVPDSMGPGVRTETP